MAGKQGKGNLTGGRSEKVIIIQYTVLIVFVLAAIVFVAFDPPSSSMTTLSGTIADVQKSTGEAGPRKLLKIQLSTGEEIDLYDTGLQCAEKGRKVVLQEQVTIFMKRKTYNIVRCAD